jgi:peptidoglycan/xylan/chitin deacetylase (PgdA/CDA1 family)
MYHWFRAGPSPVASRSPQLTITPELFERQIGYLEARGYRSVSLDQALDCGRLPARPVVLTFDDGTADFWEFARPCLLRHGFTATLFVVTGCVGGRSTWNQHLGEPPRDLMTWEHLEALKRDGFEIGSHTHSHRVLTELTPDEARQELETSRDVLAERLGAPPGFVAYPRGFYAPQHKVLARDAGYRGACAVILRWRDLRHADWFEMKRMTIKGTEGMARFRLRLALAKTVPLSADPLTPPTRPSA